MLNFQKPISEMTQEEIDQELASIRATRLGVGREHRGRKAKDSVIRQSKEAEEVSLDGEENNQIKKQRGVRKSTINCEDVTIE
jgi:hypothetical protein